MGKQSGLLQKQRFRETHFLSHGISIGEQYAIDTLQVTIHQQFGWGRERIDALTKAWLETMQEYRSVMRASDPECDVKRYHLDRVMEEILKGQRELLPFERRYPDLKTVSYGGGRK